MGKQLFIEHNGTEYRLEYTRDSVAHMERKGFRVSEITEKPMTTLPALFAGAFLANHRNIKPDTIDAIYSKLEDKGGLIGKLAEMYNEPIEALLEEPEKAEGNLKWTASW